MIKTGHRLFALVLVKCSSGSGSHKGLCFLVGDLKGVSHVCVLQWGNLLFLVQTVFITSPPPTSPIPNYHVQNFSSLSLDILIMMFFLSVQIFTIFFIFLITFWNVPQKNIVQISEFILHQLYNIWKVGKIKGSTMWRVNYNVLLYFLI